MILTQPFKYRPRLNAGKLNRKIAIQHFSTVGVDEEGIPTKDWVTTMTLWSSRKPLTNRWREYFQAAGLNAEKMLKYEIRYRPDGGITENMRLIDHGKTHELKAILDDVHGDRTETWLMAQELTDG